MARFNDPFEPMTLGNMRANGVRSLDVSCWQCHHRAIMSAEPWPDDVPVPTFGPRMVCTRCGIVGADAWHAPGRHLNFDGGRFRLLSRCCRSKTEMGNDVFEPHMGFGHGRTKPVVVENIKRRGTPPTWPSCGGTMKLA
jgi:hypothetical protein